MRKGQESPHKLPPGEAALRQHWRNYKFNAKARGLVWELSLEAFAGICQRNCFYCDAEPQMDAKVYYKGGRNATPFRCNGVDRYNNDLGYTFGNAVACCKMCNIGKNEHTFEKFRDWIARVYRHIHGETSEAQCTGASKAG